MSWSPCTGLPINFREDASGTAASDHYLKLYVSGTTTPTPMATDDTGGTTLAKAQFNSLGYCVNGSNDVFIPHIDRKYRAVLYPDSTTADNNTFASAVWDVDGINTQATETLNAVRESGEFVKEFDTMSAAIASTSLVVGDVLLVKDRADSLWDVVLSSGVTENGYNIVQGVGVGTLSYVLREEYMGRLEAYIGYQDGTSTIAVAAIDAWLAGNDVLYAGPGIYKIAGISELASDVTRVICGAGEDVTIFICDDIADAAFTPSGSSNRALFNFNIRNLVMKNLTLKSSAAVTTEENSTNGSLLMCDRVATAYPQKVVLDSVIFDGAKNDGVSGGIFSGTANEVHYDVNRCQFLNIGRFGLTIQNCQTFRGIGNRTKTAGGFIDIEPNGASDVAELVTLVGNAGQDLKYNFMQVTTATAANRGTVSMVGNTWSMSTDYVASAVEITPIVVRADEVSLVGNTMHEGKVKRILDFISCGKVTLSGNTLYATVSDSAAESIRLTNSYLFSGVNNIAINGVSNYITTSGTSGYTSLDPTTNMYIGGQFENVFNILGNGYSLDARALLQIGNLKIDSNGVGSGEFIRLKARKTDVTGISIKTDGSLNFPNLPTSASGLSAGDIWNNSGVLTIV